MLIIILLQTYKFFYDTVNSIHDINDIFPNYKKQIRDVSSFEIICLYGRDRVIVKLSWFFRKELHMCVTCDAKHTNEHHCLFL